MTDLFASFNEQLNEGWVPFVTRNEREYAPLVMDDMMEENNESYGPSYTPSSAGRKVPVSRDPQKVKEKREEAERLRAANKLAKDMKKAQVAYARAQTKINKEKAAHARAQTKLANDMKKKQAEDARAQAKLENDMKKKQAEEEERRIREEKQRLLRLEKESRRIFSIPLRSVAQAYDILGIARLVGRGARDEFRLLYRKHVLKGHEDKCEGFTNHTWSRKLEAYRFIKEAMQW